MRNFLLNAFGSCTMTLKFRTIIKQTLVLSKHTLISPNLTKYQYGGQFNHNASDTSTTNTNELRRPHTLMYRSHHWILYRYIS